MNFPAIRILMIEDDAIDAALVRKMLHGSVLSDIEVDHVVNLCDAFKLLDENEFDLILTDLSLPDSDGLETLKALRAKNEYLPIITLTGHDDDDFGLETIRAGASDYIPKDQLSKLVLARAINYSIERNRFAGIEDTNRLLESKNERLAQMYNMSQQFVDNVSHEFRTPLTVIREFAAIIRDGIDGPVTGEQQRRLGTLINRTDDLATMVDDLLDTSKLESGLLTACRCETDLYETVKQVHGMLQPRSSAKKIDLRITDIPQGTLVFCDEEKLRRVLINLIVNAIKFTPIEGSIEVSANQVDADRIEVTVSDSGPGIPTEDLNRIFERFEQVDAHHRMASCKGFGLGLSIARSLAALNLGVLKVHSQKGCGSEFSVTIPRYNLKSILNCYFDQRHESVVGNGDVSLTEVSVGDIDPDLASGCLAKVDDFLRSSIKCFDLTIQAACDRWLIFACTSEKTLPGLFERLNQEWADLKRNHYGPNLPDLSFRNLATLPAIAGRDQLIEKALVASTQDVVESADVNSEPENHVVIIEDELEVSNALESRLKATGYRTSTAHDGFAGLQEIERSKPSAIVMDIRMPKMDGLTALQKLKANPRTECIPVIMLSASLNDQHQALDAGACHFIQKPFKSESVLSALKYALGENNPTDESGPNQYLHKPFDSELCPHQSFNPKSPNNPTQP